MKTLNVIIALTLITFFSCTSNSDHGHDHDSEEHGHTHEDDSHHHDHVEQEEFTIEQDTVQEGQPEEHHTHEDDTEHHNH
jgi:hypothetical protein